MRTCLVAIICFAGLACAPDNEKLTDQLLPGESVYRDSCALCHNNGKDGAPVIGNTRTWSTLSPEWPAILEEHVAQGMLDMPPKGGQPALQDAEIAAAVDYMTSMIGPGLLAHSPDLTRGRAIYLRACRDCHDAGTSGAPMIGDKAAIAARTPGWVAVLEHHANNGLLSMPAKGGHGELSKQDVAAAVGYMIHWSTASRLGANFDKIASGDDG